MSYARFGWDNSDVYVFVSARGLECCGCGLAPPMESSRGAVPLVVFGSTADMVAHLHEHTAAGHYVPDYVIPELMGDDVYNFPAVTELGGVGDLLRQGPAVTK